MNDRIVQWEGTDLRKYIPMVEAILLEKGIEEGVTEIPDFLDEAHALFTRAAFMHQDLIIKKWMLHVSLRKPVQIKQDWESDFPHVHTAWKNSVTMVQFLQAPDSGGNLVIDGTEITPESGLCAFCTNNELHGVRPSYGQTDRVSLMVTGWIN